MKIENITKNNVSYFIAGWKASLAFNKTKTPQEIELLDFMTTDFSNVIKTFLREYDTEEFDQQGIKKMYAILSSLDINNKE